MKIPKKPANSVLFSAVVAADEAKVKSLLKAGYPTEEINEVKFTPLMVACKLGNETIAKLLIRHGANVNAKASAKVSSVRAVTPLILAAREGHSRIIELLITSGADANAQTTWKETALYEATVRKDLKMCEYLIAHGAKPTDNAAFVAVIRKMSEILRALLSAGTNPNARDRRFDDTLLGKAVSKKELDLVKLLVKAGADVNLLSARRPPLVIAACNGSAEICAVLLGSDAEVNQPDWLKRTALTVAAWRGHGDVIQLLVKSGANTSVKDKWGKTALDLARENGHLSIVQMLE